MGLINTCDYCWTWMDPGNRYSQSAQPCWLICNSSKLWCCSLKFPRGLFFFHYTRGIGKENWQDTSKLQTNTLWQLRLLLKELAHWRSYSPGNAAVHIQWDTYAESRTEARKTIGPCTRWFNSHWINAIFASNTYYWFIDLHMLHSHSTWEWL